MAVSKWIFFIEKLFFVSFCRSCLNIFSYETISNLEKFFFLSQTQGGSLWVENTDFDRSSFFCSLFTRTIHFTVQQIKRCHKINFYCQFRVIFSHYPMIITKSRYVRSMYFTVHWEKYIMTVRASRELCAWNSIIKMHSNGRIEVLSITLILTCAKWPRKNSDTRYPTIKATSCWRFFASALLRYRTQTFRNEHLA